MGRIGRGIWSPFMVFRPIAAVVGSEDVGGIKGTKEVISCVASTKEGWGESGECAGSPSSCSWGGDVQGVQAVAAGVESPAAEAPPLLLLQPWRACPSSSTPPLARLLRFSVWSRWRRVRSTSAGRGMGAKKRPERCWYAAITGGLVVTWLRFLVCKKENSCCMGGAEAEGGKLSWFTIRGCGCGWCGCPSIIIVWQRLRS